MNDLLTRMGKRLVVRRKQLHLTQEELAERADMTTKTISTAETGKKALRPENIIKLCVALDINADYLLMGKLGANDYNIFSPKVSELTPSQYRHLEDIIDAYIDALEEREA